MATVQSVTTILPDAAHKLQHRTWPLVVGVALALHGAIHLMGFVVDWQVAQLQTLPYRTSAIGGHLDLGTVGIRIVGLLWLLAAVGFITIGVRLAWQGKLLRVPIAAITALSLLLCILTWPDSAFGALIDAAILAALLVRRTMVAGQIARQGKEGGPGYGREGMQFLSFRHKVRRWRRRPT